MEDIKRGVAEIIVEEEFWKLLSSGRKLRLKQGFDPSRPDIHLGHVVGLRKLKKFQKLGHKVILIVGDWTARIGDPSGMSQTRPMLSEEEVKRNAETYMKQFFRIVDPEKTEVRWQSEWYDKFGLKDIIELTSKFTVARLMAREDFAKRREEGKPIALTELIYPILQAYDSVAIDADVEFGGIDQKFNCLIGRELQEMMGKKPQQIFLMPLLIGTDGKLKMSKSYGNYIGIEEHPRDMYGKIMSIPDHLIISYFELLTDVPLDEVKERLSKGENPMNLKKELAFEIVSEFWGREKALDAQDYFETVFQRRGVPQDIPEVFIDLDDVRDMFELLVRIGASPSKSQAKRLIEGGAVEIDGEVIKGREAKIRDGAVIRVGKRKFIRLRRG